MFRRSSEIILLCIFSLLIISCEKHKVENDGEVIENNLVSGVGSKSFQRIVGGEKLDAFHSVKTTADGGFIFCGFTENQDASERDILILKTNTKGETDWLKTYTNAFLDNGWFIDNTDDGGYIVIAQVKLHAHTPTLNPYHSQLLKIDSYGNLEWKKIFDFGDYTSLTIVKQTPDRGFISSGMEYSSNQGILLKTNNSGDEIWRKSIPEFNQLSYLDLTKEKGFIICGSRSGGSEKKNDIYLLKTNDIGEVMWSKTYGDPYDNDPRRIKEMAGGYILCGYNTNRPSGASGFVMMIDQEGNEIWSQEYQSNNIHSIGDIILSNSGNSFIAIGRENFTSISKGYVLNITQDSGNILWQRTFNHGDNNVLSEIRSCENGYINAGYSLKSGNGNGYIIKVDEDGN